LGDTLISKSTLFSSEFKYSLIFDGLKFTMQDQGRDSIDVIPGEIKYGIKSVQEIANGSGQLDQPFDVIRGMNSTGEWKIKSYGWSEDERQNINWADYAGYDNYEIRFTESGSEYYLSGYQFGLSEPVLKNEPKAKNRVPFEIWNIGRDLESAEDDTRLAIKIRDENKSDTTLAITDSTWTQLPGGDWEPVYGCIIDSEYVEPLPQTSGRTGYESHPIGRITFNGKLPEQGTIIRITTWKPLENGNTFSVSLNPAADNDFSHAKSRIDEISVFPNPYYGSEYRSQRPGDGFVRLINLPQKVTVRIYTIAGELVLKEKKDDPSPFWDWNLRNQGGIPVASGIFIIHLDMPKIGQKILKAAIVQDNYIILDN
jgi:hypothetical protein